MKVIIDGKLNGKSILHELKQHSWLRISCRNNSGDTEELMFNLEVFEDGAQEIHVTRGALTLLEIKEPKRSVENVTRIRNVINPDDTP